MLGKLKSERGRVGGGTPAFLPEHMSDQSQFTGIPKKPIWSVKWEFMERWMKAVISSADFVGLT